MGARKLRMSGIGHPMILAAMGLVADGPGLAQMAAPPPAGGASTANEIVVTARRREEAIQDVPISVSVLSGEAVERAGVENIQHLESHTPGLTISSTHTQRNSLSLSLRGQRSNGFQLTADQPVGTYFAEVIQPPTGP